MQRTLLFKTLIVALLMLLIGVPLMMIQATISDRMRFRDAGRLGQRANFARADTGTAV
ncbi:MAG: hypothetical protein NTY70_18425 [Burkholderiales bacterium]|nr:hypothetical protein [Burkholderiales bacterium]